MSKKTVASPTTPPRAHKRAWIIGMMAFASMLGLAAWWWLSALNSPPAQLLQTAAAGASMPVGHAAYVDNKQCLSCHADQAKQWEGSHHAKAMAAASPESVRGDFNNTEFKHQGIKTRFFMREGKFFVNTDGPDGKLADFEIKYAFGHDPLQQYLIEMPGGRLQPLQIAWDAPKKQWFHLLPKEKAPAGDVLHWTGRYQTANTMCIGCHTTNFEKNYDAKTDTFASRWSEPNVSCQACHGPGKSHVEWAALKAAGKAPTSVANYGLNVDTKVQDGAKQGEICVSCHARRTELDGKPFAGQPLLDNVLPTLLTSGLYHADGQQQDEVFVDGSFRQSKMHQMGVTCINCHNAHTGKVKLPGNQLCLQCHAPAASPKPAQNQKFASASGEYDGPAHHFHKQGSAGAQCVACHMPSTNYMQIQARPDHSLRIPRPDLSVKLGTPNACTQCHSDKPAQWAADWVLKWYGPKSSSQRPHFAETLSAARAGKAEATPGLIELAANLSQPSIVRATALAELRYAADVGLDIKMDASRDKSPEVRAASADSLEAAPAAQRLATLGPMLSDPVRAVRIAAARSLSSLPANEIGFSLKPAFDAALAEYIATQNVSLDMPGAQLNLAVIRQNQGANDLAEQHYLTALKIDPDFTPARANLSQLYSATGRNAKAEAVLVEGLTRMPALGELQYSLGLLLAEEKRMPEAATALTRAAKLLPERAKVHYNLGLVHQGLGQRKQAESALLTAQKLEPADPSMAYALAVFYAQGGQRAQAIQWAEKMRRPGAPDAQLEQFIARLKRGE
ncbi:tetratricopeptide repeat protein [Paucibacter sp. TC2R-5]|uniref:tetratricopeptide repeat protein n=1 Tax=Paucibacter sp. TC2R-5 TaxID=2893555 RepID=UPI0021E4F2B0|nr:multiheme c-type cytochrome [Paucibacter sp. TC2R-5]MCV2359324.1 tetratricopeptide repeat protein [Paucibacter sp. TC2R-5]